MDGLKKELNAVVAKHERQIQNSMREFSKVMIKRYSWACMVWITASYVLAAFDRQVNDGVTIAVITSLAAVLLGYFVKATKENLNKNKDSGGKDA